jgi:hypothetical protein
VLQYQIPCLLFAVALIGCTKPSPPPSLPPSRTTSSQSDPSQTQAPPDASVDFEAMRKDLTAADLAAHLSVNWQAFTCSLDEPPTEFGVDLLVTDAGKTETFRGPGCRNTKQRTYNVAFLFEASPDESELHYTLRFSYDGGGASQHGQIKNPFVGLQIVTNGAPVRFDDQGRTVVAYALPPGESRHTAAARHTDSAYRSLVLRVRETNP